MKGMQGIVLVALVCSLLVGCGVNKQGQALSGAAVQESKTTATATPVPKPSLETLQAKYKGVKAKAWGEIVPGVVTVVPNAGKTVFLTFDACGGPGGSACDKSLLDFLQQENVPATLFINSRWLDKNKDLLTQLAKNKLFSIQNHGTGHRPLTITGKSIYHIQGTVGIKGVYDEIMGTDAKIAALTGKAPRFFRSGTAYYDEVAVQIAKDLGYTVIGFDILGDAGATYSKAQIIRVAQKARDGTIIIYHMNQPQGSTCAGVKEVVKNLRDAGFKFGLIEDYI
jgi:peptidoglycan/xylan/chitin deacetylase (PgdA/CDA1 family)